MTAIKNILIIICLLIFPRTSLADAEKIFKDNNDAVVVIKTYDKKNNPLGQGSGFIISKNGAIVTNHHVIEGADKIMVKILDKAVMAEYILTDDKENDLAVLKVSAGNYPVVTLGSIKDVSIGENIYVIGSPQGLENTISDGILSGIREMAPGKRVLQITAPISEGSSGGPVFNEQGSVVGIITFHIMKAQNLNFAMPIDLVSYSAGTIKSTTAKIAIPDKIEVKKQEYTAASYENSSMKITTADDIIKKAPAEEAEYWYKLGLSYGKTKMRKEEITSYKKAVKLNPEHAMAHYNLGLAYSDLGIYDESIKSFTEAAKIRPEYAEAIYNLGLVYLTVNKKESSLVQYNKLKEIDPKLSEKLMEKIKGQSH